MEEEIINWEDISCTVIYKLEKDLPTLDFEVFEIMGHVADKNGNYVVPLYERKGSTGSGDETQNLKEAQPLFRGMIKWDACSHIYFGDEEGYIHLCGGENWRNFQEAVKRVWDHACVKLPQEHSKDMF